MNPFLSSPVWDEVDIRSLRQAAGVAALIFISSSLWTGRFRGGSAISHEKEMKIQISDPLESLADYEKAFEWNSLFGTAAPASSNAVVKTSILEASKDFRLKGVVLGASPEALMEDARNQKTLFVKVGDSVGGLTVVSIQEGSVRVKYFEEEKELKIE